jgi:hypothetical protein
MVVQEVDQVPHNLLGRPRQARFQVAEEREVTVLGTVEDVTGAVGSGRP